MPASFLNQNSSPLLLLSFVVEIILIIRAIFVIRTVINISSTHFELRSLLSALPTLPCSILQSTQLEEYNYEPHFTEEDSEAWRGK